MFLFIVESDYCGWDWTSALSIFLVGELVSVFWWVELDFFSLECNEVSSSEFWGVYGFGMTLSSLSFMLRVVFLLCCRISVVCLKLIGSWVELGFSVGMEIWG